MSQREGGSGRFVLLGLAAVALIIAGLYLLDDRSPGGRLGSVEKVEAASQQVPTSSVTPKTTRDEWLRPRASEMGEATLVDPRVLDVERLDPLRDQDPRESETFSGFTWIQGVVLAPEGKEWKGTLSLRSGRDRPEIVDSSSFSTGQPFRLLAERRGRYEIQAELAGSALSVVLKKDIVPSGPFLDLGDLRLSPGRSVQGRVLSPDGQPLARALVNLELRWEPGMGPIEDRSGPSSGSVETKRNGSFELKWIPPGDYWLVVRHRGFPPLKKGFRMPEEPRSPGRAVVRMKVGWLFSGQVEDLRGKALVGVRIRAEASAHDPAWSGAVSDGKGLFEVRVSGRRLRVTIEKEGYPAVRIMNVIPTSRPRVFRLAPGTTLEGRVVGDGGLPDSPVSLRLIPRTSTGGAAALEQRTDKKGRFEFKGVADGTYTLFGIHASLGVCQTTVRIPEQKDVALRFRRAMEVTFEVVTEAGFPLSGAKVEIIQAYGWEVRSRFAQSWSEPTRHELDYQGRLVFPTSRGTRLIWTIRDDETGEIRSGSVRAERGKVHRIRFARYGKLFGALDIRALTDRDSKGDLLMQLVDETDYVWKAMVCTPVGEGRYAFRSPKVRRGTYRLRLVLLGGSGPQDLTLAQSVHSLFVRPGKDNRIRCSVAEKQD